MKNLTKLVAVFVIVFSAASPSAFGQTLSTPPIQIKTYVDETLTISATVKADDPVTKLPTGPALGSMDHGTLVRSESTDGEHIPYALRGKAFHVFVGVNTSGRRYTLTSTMAPMTSGRDTLPRALGVFGIQATNGQNPNPLPIGGTFAVDNTGADAVGTDKLLYTSATTGKGGVIELVYGLSGGKPKDAQGNVVLPFPGWEPVPPDQLTGHYSSSVVFTVTLLT